MPGDQQQKVPMQDRINDILNSGRSTNRTFAATEQAAEVDELEFQLARAEVDLCSARTRVEEINRKLTAKRRRVSGQSL